MAGAGPICLLVTRLAPRRREITFGRHSDRADHGPDSPKAIVRRRVVSGPLAGIADAGGGQRHGRTNSDASARASRAFEGPAPLGSAGIVIRRTRALTARGRAARVQRNKPRCA